METKQYFSADYYGKVHIQRPAYPHATCCGLVLNSAFSRDARTLPEERYCINCEYNFPIQQVTDQRNRNAAK